MITHASFCSIWKQINRLSVVNSWYTTTNTLLNRFQQWQTKLLHCIKWFPNKAKRSLGYHELTTLCACTQGITELLNISYLLFFQALQQHITGLRIFTLKLCSHVIDMILKPMIFLVLIEFVPAIYYLWYGCWYTVQSPLDYQVNHKARIGQRLCTGQFSPVECKI